MVYVPLLSVDVVVLLIVDTRKYTIIVQPRFPANRFDRGMAHLYCIISCALEQHSILPGWPVPTHHHVK